MGTFVLPGDIVLDDKLQAMDPELFRFWANCRDIASMEAEKGKLYPKRMLRFLNLTVAEIEDRLQQLTEHQLAQKKTDGGVFWVLRSKDEDDAALRAKREASARHTREFRARQKQRAAGHSELPPMPLNPAY